MIHPIYPCLWFDGVAQKAAEFYCGIFPDSQIISVSPLVVLFEINKQQFMGLNGGPKYRLNEAVSFVIECDTQNEIDSYWEKLSLGGEPGRCGWLKDQFGVSWQIVPKILKGLLQDTAKAPKIFEAFRNITKFEIDALCRI